MGGRLDRPVWSEGVRGKAGPQCLGHGSTGTESRVPGSREGEARAWAEARAGRGLDLSPEALGKVLARPSHAGHRALSHHPSLPYPATAGLLQEPGIRHLHWAPLAPTERKALNNH